MYILKNHHLRVYGVLCNITFDSKVIRSNRILLLSYLKRTPETLHLVGGLPSARNDFPDAALFFLSKHGWIIKNRTSYHGLRIRGYN